MNPQMIQHNTCSPAGSVSMFTTQINQQEDSEIAEVPKKHCQKINKIIEELFKATLVLRRGQSGSIRIGGRKNKNEILALTLARLIKEKHLKALIYSDIMYFAREIQMHPNNGEFVLVLRTDGRIVAISDEAEHHLEKSMRSLYSQLVNIFECLDQADNDKLRLILGSSVDSTRQEHRLVCTLRLPKGKRPSRVNEDVKTITMAGHFFYCQQSSSSTSNERLFIARCETLISATVNRSGSSKSTSPTTNNYNGNSIVKFTLNEDMTIQTVSSNAQSILGYSNKDMFGNWLGRYVASNDMEKFEVIRQKYLQREPEQQQQSPISVCDIFDMYTNNGEGRLTFLYQIRPIRERRKPVKFAVVTQLVDPSLRHEFVKYVQSEGEITPKPPKAEQVNLGAPLSSSVSETSKDAIMAHSPTFSNVAERIFDGTTQFDYLHQPQYSPFNDILSNRVAPFSIHEQSWDELFDIEYSQQSTADFHYWSNKSNNVISSNDQFDEELTDAVNEYCY